MSNQDVAALYTEVIDEVCSRMVASFDEVGVGRNILAELRRYVAQRRWMYVRMTLFPRIEQTWKDKIFDANVADFANPVGADYEIERKLLKEEELFPTDGVDRTVSFETVSTLAALAASAAYDKTVSENSGGGAAGQDSKLPDTPESKAKVPKKTKAKVKRIGQHDGMAGDEDEDTDDEDEDNNEINSDLDEDESDETSSQLTNLVLCQYTKVKRVKNNWKCSLVDGIMTINERDHVFNKLTCDFNW
ncbi:transcription factor IIA, alpha/beta subunit-domain-containing protein [Powellomyces hirtus]|nr:transcription factor IIA, alpha/beta subunit-domain-containing protein [Powellomyces hirtus]